MLSRYGMPPSETLSKDLLDSAIEWFTAATGEHIIGYAKLRPLSSPVPDPPKGALELQQIYVLRDWQTRGVAERLMHWALDRARARCTGDISYGF